MSRQKFTGGVRITTTRMRSDLRDLCACAAVLGGELERNPDLRKLDRDDKLELCHVEHLQFASESPHDGLCMWLVLLHLILRSRICKVTREQLAYAL